MTDLNTGGRTPLPDSIIRSLGGTAEGRGAESQYAASPDGSLLAYVGTGEEGTPQIFIAGIDGTGIRQMTHDPSRRVSGTGLGVTHAGMANATSIRPTLTK